MKLSTQLCILLHLFRQSPFQVRVGFTNTLHPLFLPFTTSLVDAMAIPHNVIPFVLTLCDVPQILQHLVLVEFLHPPFHLVLDDPVDQHGLGTGVLEDGDALGDDEVGDLADPGLDRGQGGRVVEDPGVRRVVLVVGRVFDLPEMFQPSAVVRRRWFPRGGELGPSRRRLLGSCAHGLESLSESDEGLRGTRRAGPQQIQKPIASRETVGHLRRRQDVPVLVKPPSHDRPQRAFDRVVVVVVNCGGGMVLLLLLLLKGDCSRELSTLSKECSVQ